MHNKMLVQTNEALGWGLLSPGTSIFPGLLLQLYLDLRGGLAGVTAAKLRRLLLNMNMIFIR